MSSSENELTSTLKEEGYQFKPEFMEAEIE